MNTRTMTPIVFALGLIALLSGPATAAPEPRACAPYALVSEQLEQKFNEVPTAFGLVEDKSVMQLYSSADSGTWTIVMTSRQGVSCIVAAGHSLEQMGAEPVGPGA